MGNSAEVVNHLEKANIDPLPSRIPTFLALAGLAYVAKACVVKRPDIFARTLGKREPVVEHCTDYIVAEAISDQGPPSHILQLLHNLGLDKANRAKLYEGALNFLTIKNQYIQEGIEQVRAGETKRVNITHSFYGNE